MKSITKDAISLLQHMIRIPSLSKQESEVADKMEGLFHSKNWNPQRIQNNIWVTSKHWKDDKPTCLLNSHIDTVKPADSYTYDPYGGVIEAGKLIGLGSNDAGASVVSLIAAFNELREKDLPFNIVLLISAEEEISGQNGVELALKQIPDIDFGIIGEPTNKSLCIAEKGLMVLDGKAFGKSGHAARSNGINAIDKAIADIQLIQTFNFDRTSALLGKTKATVTQIDAGTQHNVIPDQCHYVVDVRTNELYKNQEVVDILNGLIEGELIPRSIRLNSSKMDLNHPVAIAAQSLGMSTIGSPTLSDQALMQFPTVKMGPGDSKRSHTADEFIYLEEINDGIQAYIDLLNNIRID